MKLYALTGLVLLSACASTPKQAPNYLQSMPEYVDNINSHTRFARKYDGFYEVFRGHATLLTPECQTAILKQRASILQWDEHRYQDERLKAQQESSTQTKFFLQFYTPEPDYNDLNAYNTIWHVYLEVGDRHFEGKVAKAKGKTIEFQSIYPNFDMFSTAYEITFNIATGDIVHQDAKLKLASSLGDAEFEFGANP